jgi:hypothetical protein
VRLENPEDTISRIQPGSLVKSASRKGENSSSGDLADVV